MALDELKSIDYSFEISLNNIAIRSDDLEAIDRAWAEGHYIYWMVYRYDFPEIQLKIFSVASRLMAPKDAEDITRTWRDVEKVLKKNEVPDEMVINAMEVVRKRMEEWV